MQIHITKIKLAVLAMLFALTAKAQFPIDTTGLNTHSWLCGNDSSLFARFTRDTSFINPMARFNDSVSGKTASTDTIVIPVVFHIIATNANTTTYAQVKWAVASLNAYFNKSQYQLFTGKTLPSNTRAVDTYIEFRLACNPMPTSGTNTATVTGLAGWSNSNEPGVVRYSTSNSTVLNQGYITASTYTPMLSMTNPTGFFPKANYLNIYCVSTIASPPGLSGTILAYGTFPWMNLPGGLDGIVTRLDCIGSNTYPNGFPMFSTSYDKGAVLAHEVGHYLGLYHTFQPNSAGTFTVPVSCYGTTSVTATSDGDLLLDTPPTRVNYDLGNILTINSCLETNYPYGGSFPADVADQLENFMCYSDDNKRNTFTAGQAGRMTASTFTSTPYNRSVLVSSNNLTYTTGVGTGTVTTSPCANYTGIVTGIFNWGIISSGCTGAATVQFTNPKSLDFNAPSTITYSWTFGDGTPTYTTTTSPISHAYTSTTTTTYTVSCIAGNGTVTNTYSTVISTSSNLAIVGCSGTTNTVSPYNSTVCRNTEQTILVRFSKDVPFAIITDGTYTYTVNNNMVATHTTVTIPYLITTSVTASYSLVPYCNNGIATFSVTDCCSNMIANGDFESGYIGFTTDLTTYTTTPGPGSSWWGAYDVNALTPSGSMFGWLPIMNTAQNTTGKVLQVDGFYGPNTVLTTFPPASPSSSGSCYTSTLTPRVWQETLTGLLPSTKYFYSFKILENYNASGSYTSQTPNCYDLNFQTNIKSSSITALATQTLAPTVAIQVSALDWQVYTYTFATTSSVTPSTTFSITINQINNFGASYYDYMIDNIALQAMTPAIQAISNNICVGNSTQLSAVTNCGANLSDYNYTWSPAASVTCYTCLTTSASPTTTTVYTLVATSTSTATPTPPDIISNVTVLVTSTVTCSGTAPTYSPTAGSGTYSLTTNPTLVSSDIEVKNGVTYIINSADVRMASGKGIYIDNGGTLIIKGSWIHACSTCGPMWAGITVATGGTLTIGTGTGTHGTTYNIIEDATTAVTTASSNSATPIPYFGISDVIFNNNGDDIFINHHVGDLSSLNVTQSVFTCRSLSSHVLTATNYNAIKADIRAATPILTSTTNPTDLTMAGTRSAYGVFISTQNVTHPISIGDPTLGSNLFDNHDFGIYSAGAYLISKNCRFQNMTGNTYSTTVKGAGIYAEVVDGYQSPLQVGNSNTTIDNAERDTFLNCLVGVYANSYLKEFINNNYFNNETTASASSFTTSGAYVTGEYGVFNKAYATSATTITPEQMIVANNNINNYATGFWLGFKKLYNTNSGSSNGSGYIYKNKITGTGTNTLYCNYGVYLQQSGSFGANSGVPWDAMSVSTNTITNVNSNCIIVNSVSTNTANVAGCLTISGNTELSVKYNSAATATVNPPMAAVYLTSCNYVKVSNNPLITTTGSSGTYSVSMAQYIAGIYVTQSNNSRITCNSVSYVGEDFVWNGNSTGSIWYENKMHNSRYGLVLRNTGVMGNQGGTGTGQHAIFAEFGKSSTDITSSQTLSDGSDPSNASTPSKITDFTANCSAGSTNIPCTNTVVVGTSATAYSLTTTLITTTATTTYSLCTAEGGSGRMAATNNGQSFNANDTTTNIPSDSMLLSLLAPSPTLPAYDYETRWANQYYVSNVNPNLTANANYSNAKTFALIDKAIISNDYSTAQTLLNGITANNVIEQNWQAVNNIIIKQADTLSVNDVSTLQTIAQQCPLTGGSIVWRARAILNDYYNNIINYPNDCSNGGNGGAKIESTSNINNIVNNQNVNLYPNPNNGKMMVEYKITSDATMQITDVTGKIINTYKLNATEKSIEINNENLINGVYLYTVINGQGLIKTGRIIIMK